MGRSEKFPTHYKIGILDGKDVYYNPQEGLAVEREGYLVEMTFGERCAVGESLLAEWENQCPVFRNGECTDPAGCVHPETGQLTCWHWDGVIKAADGPDYSERPACVTRNVRLGMKEW